MNWLVVFLILLTATLVVGVQTQVFLRLRLYARRLERETTQQTKELLLYQTLDIRLPLPPMRGWAISPDIGWFYVSKIFEMKPQTIVECGSGVSTLLAAYSLKRLGSGQVIALEHDEVFAQQTRQQIRSHGLEDYAQVLSAPLIPHTIKETSFRWYDVTSMHLHQPIDLLLVDGPPGTLQKQSRYPALPLLRSYLHPKSWILMDDANRQDEQEISKRWEEEFGLTSQTLPAEKGALLLTFKFQSSNDSAQSVLTP